MRLTVLHRDNIAINKGSIIDISITIKLRVIEVIQYKEFNKICESICNCEIVVNMI